MMNGSVGLLISKVGNVATVTSVICLTSSGVSLLIKIFRVMIYSNIFLFGKAWLMGAENPQCAAHPL
ncbi:MAG TPA: hypothetical protein VK997_08325 [Deferrisomatales bacterium]|nr:hypothetical protein [Deferrisomatales bacterium]